MDKAPGDVLASKHAELDAQIATEEHRRHPNDATLTRLKKEKLLVKDELVGATLQ